MRLSPYPRYKPSGIEWIGDIPEHWNVKPLKHLASINDETLSETTDPTFEMSYVDISSVDTIRGIVTTDKMAFEEAPSRARRIVRDGDTIVSTVRTHLKAIAHIQKPAHNMIVSTGFAVIRPCTVAPTFMSYAMHETGFIETIVARSVGVSYPAVNANEIETIPVPLPSYEEQAVIANYLDHEIAKINALALKKQVLIERLKEKRIALISHTVTHGLPLDTADASSLAPHPKLKPSGVEWLGEVPEHWETKRLRFILSSPLKYGANEVAAIADPDLPRYVRITDIDENDSLREETFRSLPWDVAAEYILREGDILFARSGATAGKTFLYRNSWGACAYAGYLIRASLDTQKVVPEFLRYVTASMSYWQWLASAFIQSTIQNVSAERYANLWIPLPPTGEQYDLVQYLNRETAKIDQLIAKIETAIERLQEYRSALITAAVTGKIDVRGAMLREHSASTSN